jgi:dolichol-phosphate mannosyltransferase
MIVVTVLGSVQLSVLGIIGHYLGRIHEQTRGRPLFLVESVYRPGKRELEPEPSTATATGEPRRD